MTARPHIRTRTPGPRSGDVLGAVALALALLLCVPEQGEAAEQLRVVDDEVTGSFVDTPVAEAVAAIARTTGAEVAGAVESTARVSVDLREAPLVSVLRRFLGGQGFHLLYGGGGGLRRIALQQANGSAHVVIVPSPSPTPVLRTKPSFVIPAAPPEMLDYRLTVQEGGALSGLMHGDVSVSELMHFAMRHDDPWVRADALHTGLSALGEIPGARAWLKDVFAAVARHPLQALRASLDPAARAALSALATDSGGEFETPAREVLAVGAPDAP